MNRVFKTFLLWLLMAALPVQGMAAAARAACGPGHHDMGAAMVKAVEDGHAHQHDADASDHHHELAHGSHAVPEAGHADGAAGVSLHSEHVHASSYCSACAACCVGASAPPPLQSPVAALNREQASSASPAISFTGFIPSSLERPPRQVSA